MWRKIQKEDIRRGLILRMTKIIDDGSYGMCTVIGIPEDIPSDPYAQKYPSVTVSRPYVYAHKHYNSNQPLMGAETFTVEVSRLLENEGYEVFQGRDDVRSMSK